MNSASRNERNCALAGDGGPGRNADRQRDDGVGGLADGDDDDNEQEGRDGLEQLGQANQRGVQPAAEIAPNGADQRADAQADRGGRHADQQRYPRAVGKTGRNVASRLSVPSGKAGSWPGHSVGVPAMSSGSSGNHEPALTATATTVARISKPSRNDGLRRIARSRR